MAQSQKPKPNSNDLLQHDQETKQRVLSKEDKDKDDKMSMLQKMATNASLCANEAAANFEHLYSLPILQSLGLPLRLVSMTGAIAGPTSVVIIPLLGWLTDLGSNPHTRKIKAVIFSCGMTFLSMVCVVMANMLHLNYLLEYTAEANDSISFSVPHGVIYSNFSNGWDGRSTIWEHVTNTSEGVSGPDSGLQDVTYDSILVGPAETRVTNDESEVPFKAALGLVGFILLEIGFDANNAFIKALLLSCSPRTEHTSLLVIGLVIASSGGVSTAAVGLIDVTSLLGLSYIEGAALTIQTIFQGTVTIIILVIGLIITLLTIRRQLKLRNASLEETTSFSKPTESHATRQGSIHREEQLSQSTIQGAFENSIRSFGGSSVYIDQSLALLEASQHSLSIHRHGHQDTSTEYTPLLGAERLPEETTEDLKRSQLASLSVSCRRKCSFLCVPEHVEGRTLSLSDPMEADKSVEELPVGDVAEAKARSGRRERSFKVKIFFITLATYFSASDVFLFSMNSSDFVGKAIYGGDPAAQPGSQSLTLYQEGVRTTSVGFVVYYSSFLFFNLVQYRILACIGNRAEFVIAHLNVSVMFVALSVTERLEVYFLMTVVAGFHRACIFSVSFSVTNDLIQARASELGHGKGNVGFAFSLVSASMPLAFCTIYSWVAPVEDLLGVVAFPFWLGSVTAVLSVCAFLAVGKV